MLSPIEGRSNMLTIWKFEVPVQDNIQIEMPKGARILSVQAQRNLAALTVGDPIEQVCLWALVNPEATKEIRGFRMVGTDHPIQHSEKLTYIGTFQMQGGALVFHLFEKGRPS
jgi:hypothetical protein